MSEKSLAIMFLTSIVIAMGVIGGVEHGTISLSVGALVALPVLGITCALMASARRRQQKALKAKKKSA